MTALVFFIGMMCGAAAVVGLCAIIAGKEGADDDEPREDHKDESR